VIGIGWLGHGQSGPAQTQEGISVDRKLRAIVLALVAALMLGIAACGDDDDDDGGNGGGGGGDQAAQEESIKAGVVTDIGGLNDRSFNASANAGIKRAAKDLGIEERVLISKSQGDYVPNLTTLAQQQFDLIIGVGFLMADAMNTVASKLPDTNFAIVDFSATGLKDKPQNVQGLLFKEQEAGYLAGYLAGLWAKDNNAKVVSTVGGQKIPPVDHYIAGFHAGAKKANPGIQTLNGYSQDFVDQAKCKEIALDQIAKGSKVVFQVAGGCGLGALDAAKEKGVQAIGVDADQGYLGDHILTSALKNVDVAVFNAIKRAQEGQFEGGTDVIATVENGGVGLGKLSAEGQPYADQMKEIEDQIASGEITNIPDTFGKQ
jgi:basic membrane protein A and related proteins